PPQVKKGEGPEAIREDPSRHRQQFGASEREPQPPAGSKQGRPRAGTGEMPAEQGGAALTHLDVTV
ncbi:MAG TPA: hypothetical protein GX513_09490, partial [Firmicutes bacterium]|nr:hypothetical protein [Bacillota bacterium]